MNVFCFGGYGATHEDVVSWKKSLEHKAPGIKAIGVSLSKWCVGGRGYHRNWLSRFTMVIRLSAIRRDVQLED
jgi:hypothetical protein